MAETAAVLNIVGLGLTTPLTAKQNSSILEAVNATLLNFPDIASIRIGNVQVGNPRLPVHCMHSPVILRE